jgi:hypothetical protein
VTPTDNVPYAVLSVGGFLGMGTRLVVVSYDTMKAGDKNMVLPGATRDTLKVLPGFSYAEQRLVMGTIVIVVILILLLGGGGGYYGYNRYGGPGLGGVLGLVLIVLVVLWLLGVLGGVQLNRP